MGPLRAGEGGKRRGRLFGIGGRLITWFVLGVLGSLLFGGGVAYYSGVSAIQATLAQTFCQIASNGVGEFESRLARDLVSIRKLATDPLTTAVAVEVVANYRNRPDQWIEARAQRLAAEWTEAGSQAERQKFLHPQLSYRLSVLAGLAPDRVRRFSVYDLRGLLVAASAPPATRLAADSRWMRLARTRDEHFNYADLNRDPGVMTVVVPVWSGVAVTGYVVAELVFASLAETVSAIRFGETGEGVLVDYAGVPLVGDPRGFLVQALARRPEIPASATGAAQSAAGNGAFWIPLPNADRWLLWSRLVCVAPLPMINRARAEVDLPPWFLVVTQAPAESYAVLSESLGSLLLAGLAGIVVVGGLGVIAVWHMVRPIKRLRAGVRHFAEGRRGHVVEVESRDEIGELAEEFNIMAARVTHSETELRAFAQAVTDAADAILMADPDGMIYYANPAFEAVTGYTPTEVLGKRPSILRSEETSPEIYGQMWACIEAGKPWRGELVNRHKNGRLYPVDLTISPVHDEDGEVVALLGIHRDISLARTYRDELEREVDARSREIAETKGLADMGRMASMIAHDLRNTLSTVKMNLQILSRRGVAGDDVQNEHCRIGLDQVRYMEDMVRDMLSFARPERLRGDWHDPDQLLIEALASVTPFAESKGISVHTGDNHGLPKLYCDKTKIIGVVRNLIDNAIQATGVGGRIEISTQIALDTAEPMVWIQIKDSGAGIDKDTLEKVFEPFFTTRSKGTGLGLAIVKRIVEQHGGEVTVSSVVDEGTSVAFGLPTEPRQAREEDGDATHAYH